MSRYREIALIEGRRSSVVYAVPPESPDDFYVVSTIGDRFDTLAQQFYSDSEYWWIIAAANPTVRRDSLNIDTGIQIRIPGSLAETLRFYENVNLSR